MITILASDLALLPNGHVLLRWLNNNGTHFKMRIVKTTHFTVCEECDGPINGKAVRSLGGAGNSMTRFPTLCLKCGAKELNLRIGSPLQ